MSRDKNSKIRAQNRINRICKIYERKLKEEGSGGVTIYITLFRQKRIMLEKEHFDPNIEQKIIAEIDRHRINYCDEQNRGRIFQKYYNNKPEYEYVESIRIIQNRTDQIIVDDIFADIVKTIDNECLLKCISKKNLKLKSYKSMGKNKDIEEYWLCIYLPPSEFMDFERKTDFPDFSSEPESEAEPKYTQIFITQYDDVLRIK